MHLPIAATLFALFILGFRAVQVMVSRPSVRWWRHWLVEGALVMVLTSLVSFALGLAFNFFATLSEQTFGPVQLAWTVVALAVALVGGWMIRPSTQAARLEVVGGAPRGPGPTPATPETHGSAKISQVA